MPPGAPMGRRSGPRRRSRRGRCWRPCRSPRIAAGAGHPSETGLEVHVPERSTRSALEAQAGRLGFGLGGGDDDARDVHELADVRAVQRPDRRRRLVRDEVHLDLELVEHVLGTADARDERILLRVEPSLVAKGLQHGHRGVLQAGYVNVRLVADLLGELRVVRCGWVSGGTLVGGAGFSGGARRGTGGRARSGHDGRRRWVPTGFERGRVDDSRVRRRIARTRAMRVLPRANRSPMMSSRSTVTSLGGVSWSSLSRYTRRPSGYSAVGSLLKFLRKSANFRLACPGVTPSPSRPGRPSPSPRSV